MAIDRGKRFVVVVNPRGGRRRGLAVLDEVTAVFASAGAELDVHLTERPGHARHLAKTLDLAGCDGFCTIGGDGTIHEVAGGLLDRSNEALPPLGIIPAGTGNTLHHEIGGGCLREAAERILAGRTRNLDAARVIMPTETVFCVNIIGWGAVADINGTAERLRLLGERRYAAAALWHVLRPKPRRAKLILDDQAMEGEFLFIIACNTKTTGSGMIVAPRAEIDDGKLDVVILRNTSRAEMLQALAKVFDGSHLSLPSIVYRQVGSFSIACDPCGPLDLDGENEGHAPFRVEMLPAALRVLV